MNPIVILKVRGLSVICLYATVTSLPSDTFAKELSRCPMQHLPSNSERGNEIVLGVGDQLTQSLD